MVMAFWRLLAADYNRYTFIVMSTYSFYQAFPEQSLFMGKLRSNQKYCAMYSCLLGEPSGPYNALKVVELHEQYPEIFVHCGYSDSLEFANALRDELFGDLRMTLADSPGLDSRSGSIRLSDSFDQKLHRSLQQQNHPDPVSFTEWITMGRDRFVPEMLGNERDLRLNSSEFVSEASMILNAINPAPLAAYTEDFEWLRKTYREAAQRNEALLYG